VDFIGKAGFAEFGAERFETGGLITIPLIGDTPPVADLLAEIIRTFNRNMCGYCNLGWLDTGESSDFTMSLWIPDFAGMTSTV
jgi:hypothetical protein